MNVLTSWKRPKMKKSLFLILCLCSIDFPLKGEEFYDGTLEASPLEAEETLSPSSGYPEAPVSIVEQNDAPQADQVDDRVSQLEKKTQELQGQLEKLQHKMKELLTQQSSASTELMDSSDEVSHDKSRKTDEKASSDKTKAKVLSDKSTLEGGSALQHYEEAQEHLTQKDYPEAERTLKNLLHRYPSDPLAVNAHYWLGEIYYIQKEYRRAATAFGETYKLYQKLNRSSDAKDQQARKVGFAKAPEALVKLALSLKALGKKEEACITLDQLRSEFPHLPQNVKKLVERTEQSLNQCKKASGKTSD